MQFEWLKNNTVYLSYILKQLFTKKTISAGLGVLVVILLFILTSYLASVYKQNIKLFVETDGLLGKVGYILITALAVVIAPISTLPLIPLASMLWGWVITGALSVLGWVIGSQIAFILARKYGRPLVEKITSLEKLETFEKNFSQKNMFWIIVFLRMTVPVDVLSYALGIFSEIQQSTFFFATLIGVTPFAFIFAYTGTLSIGNQIIVLTEIATLLGIAYFIKKKISS